MTKRFALPLLLTGALALAACGSDDPATTSGGGGGGASASAPAPADLLSKAISSSEDLQSAAFALTATVTGESSDPQVQPFLEQPIKVDLSGKAASKAVDIAGTANVGGQDFKFGLRADDKQGFIQFGDTWYGPDGDITTTSDSSPTDPAELKQSLEKIRQYGNDVLTGEVTEAGDTWEFNGTLNPDGIVKVAEAEGEPMSADDQAGLRAIAPLVKIKFATGKDDGRFRQLGIDFKLTEAQIKLLNSMSDEPIPLTALAVTLNLELSGYGDPVTIEAPADPQPTDALGGALLGAMFSLTG